MLGYCPGCYSMTAVPMAVHKVPYNTGYCAKNGRTFKEGGGQLWLTHSLQFHAELGHVPDQVITPDSILSSEPAPKGLRGKRD